MRVIKRLGLQLTQGCNLACRHCGTFSSPSVHSLLDADIARYAIDSVASINPAATVGFTGGEIFTVEPYLWDLISRVRERGLAFSAVTNAFWGEDSANRDRILDGLIGCARLGLSSDNFHAPAVPKRQVGDTLKAALDKDIDAVIRYTACEGESAEKIWAELGIHSDEERDRVIIGPVMPMGRARRLLRDPDLFPVEEEGPCRAASIIMIKCTGEAFACCGESLYLESEVSNPLKIGDLRTSTLEELQKRHEESLVVQAMRTIGPRAIARNAGCVGTSVEAEVKSRSSCGSCALAFRDAISTHKVSVELERNASKVRALKALYYGEV